MIILKRLFLFLVLYAVTFVAQGHTRNDKNEINRKYDYFYLEAISQKLNGDLGSALNLLNHCIALCPDRPEAYYDRGVLLNTAQLTKEALPDFEKALSLDKSEKVYKKSLFYQTLILGNYEKAKELGEEICKRSADLQIYSILLSIYNTQKDYDGMLRTLESIENINGPEENITLAKMQIFERRGEKNRAYEELKKLSDSSPRNTSYKVMLGNWMLQNDRAEEAYQIYKEVLDANPDDIAANMSMLDYYRSSDRNDDADKLTEKMLMSEVIPGDSKVVLMNQLIQNYSRENKDSVQVLQMFDKVLASPGSDVDIAEMKAAYMQVKKMPQEQVIAAFKDALEMDPYRISVRLQILQEYWNKQDYKSVIEYSKPTEEYTPDDITVYYFLGLAYLMTDQDENTLNAMRSGMEYVNDESNTKIVSDMYSVIGDVLHSMGKLDEAYCAYDSCLIYNENNIGCLNNYAYFLSVEGRNLGKAEEMSRKTIIAEPNNNTYLDTYAWILFLQGKYNEAKIYMDQILSTSKEDEDLGATIYDHLGDVYSMNNEAEKALEYWNKAKTAGSDNKVLDQKIKEGKYIPEKK